MLAHVGSFAAIASSATSAFVVVGSLCSHHRGRFSRPPGVLKAWRGTCASRSTDAAQSC